MTSRQFNLADLFEEVVDTVPDRPALVAGGPSADLPPARRAGQPVRPRSREPGRRLRRPRRHTGPQLRRVGRGHDRLLQGADRPGQPQLPLRRLRAVLRHRQRRPRDPRVRAGPVTAGGRVDRRTGVRTDRSTWWPSTTARRRPRCRPPSSEYEDALASAAPDRDFGPRSPDDVYVLYTGGTTGMPKGVIWRQEDIFFAAMGGGGWGAAPIETADELAGRLDPDDDHRVTMLVMAPLMHGNAQWVMWNAFMMGGTAVLYTDHRYDPDRVLRLIGDEGVVSVGLVGDAMARPLAEALASAAARDLRHLHTGRHRIRRGHAVRRRSRTSSRSSCPPSSSWTGSDRVRAGPREPSRTALRDHGS